LFPARKAPAAARSFSEVGGRLCCHADPVPRLTGKQRCYSAAAPLAALSLGALCTAVGAVHGAQSPPPHAGGMGGGDFVSPEGLRKDGRRPRELRRMGCQIDVLASADGSAIFEMGNTKARCSTALQLAPPPWQASATRCCATHTPSCLPGVQTGLVRAAGTVPAGAGSGVWAQGGDLTLSRAAGQGHRALRILHGSLQHRCAMTCRRTQQPPCTAAHVAVQAGPAALMRRSQPHATGSCRIAACMQPRQPSSIAGPARPSCTPLGTCASLQTHGTRACTAF